MVNDENTSNFLTLFDAARSKTKNIRVIINSGGGDPDCAFAIYDAIKRSKIVMETVAEGGAASAAVIIFLAGIKRYITPHSYLMVHEPKGGSSDGLLTDFEQKLRAGYLTRVRNMYVSMICEKTGMPRKKVLKDIRLGKFYSAEEAIKYGLAHKVI